MFQFFAPSLAELGFNLPLLAIPFAYYLGDSPYWVAWLVLLHIVIVVALAGVAVLNTGSPKQTNSYWFVVKR